MQESPPAIIRYSDYAPPSIKISVSTFTSREVLEAVRNALQKLEEEYGIYLSFDLINVDLAGSSVFFDEVEAVVDILGTKMIITREMIEDECSLKQLEDTIAYEALKNLGRMKEKIEGDSLIPSDSREPPELTTAIFDEEYLITI